MHHFVVMVFLVALSEECQVGRGSVVGRSRVETGDCIGRLIVVVLVTVGGCCCTLRGGRRVGSRRGALRILRVRLRNRPRRNIVGLAVVAVRGSRFGLVGRIVEVGVWDQVCRKLKCSFREADDPSTGTGGAEGLVGSQHTDHGAVASEAVMAYGFEEVEKRLGMEAEKIAEIAEVAESRASRC